MIKLKSLLFERSDGLYYKGINLDPYNSEEVDAVFSIYSRYNYWLLYKNNSGIYYPYTSDDEVLKKLTSFSKPPIHRDIYKQFLYYIPKIQHEHRGIDGRIWNVKKNNVKVVSFWANMNVVTHPTNRKILFDMLTKCGYDYKSLLYEFENEDGIFYGYDNKIFPETDDEKNIETTNSKETELRKKIHSLDPSLKKQLLAMTPNKKDDLAKKAGFKSGAEFNAYLNIDEDKYE